MWPPWDSIDTPPKFKILENTPKNSSKLGRETAAERQWLQPLLRQVCRDGAEVTWSGKLLQMREAAVGNALSPTVDSRVGGTISADVEYWLTTIIIDIGDWKLFFVRSLISSFCYTAHASSDYGAALPQIP